MNLRPYPFIVLLFLGINCSLAQTVDTFTMTKVINVPFQEAVDKVKAALEKQEFGIQMEIDMDGVLKKKIGADIRPYKILGACNPSFAYETIKAEENIGIFLPCKVLVKQVDASSTEIVMINPTELMKMLDNEDLMPVANEVTERFRKALAML